MKRAAVIGILVTSLLVAQAAFAQAQEPSIYDCPAAVRGFKADQLYQFGEIDHVNTCNGSFLLTIPFGGTYPVASALSYGLTLTCNANLWDHSCWCGQGDPGYRCWYSSEPHPAFNVLRHGGREPRRQTKSTDKRRNLDSLVNKNGPLRINKG